MDNDKLKGRTLYCNGVNFGEDFFKMTGVLEDFSKPNPDAPKDVEGSYALTVNGRTTTLSDGKDKVSVTCHVDDNFDVGEGVRQCFEKMKKEREKKIQIGDMVEIINSGDSYSQYAKYFNNEGMSEYAPYFRYGVVPKEGVKGKVLHIDKYDHALIQTEADEKYGDSRYGGDCFGGLYIIGLDGLRKVVD